VSPFATASGFIMVNVFIRVILLLFDEPGIN